MKPIWQMTEREAMRYHFEEAERQNEERIKAISINYKEIKDEIENLQKGLCTLLEYTNCVLHYPCVNFRKPTVEIKRDKRTRRLASIITFDDSKAYIYTNKVRFTDKKDKIISESKFRYISELTTEFKNFYGHKNN